MWNSGKKVNILTLVLSEKKILNETKNHNPPFKLIGRSLNIGGIVDNKTTITSKQRWSTIPPILTKLSINPNKQR
jgi:hypothetical protein